MIERRSFLAIMAMALGLPKALWQRQPKVSILTDATITTPSGVTKVDAGMQVVLGHSKQILKTGDFLAVDGGQIIRAAGDHNPVIGVALEDVRRDGRVNVLLMGSQ